MSETKKEKLKRLNRESWYKYYKKCKKRILRKKRLKRIKRGCRLKNTENMKTNITNSREKVLTDYYIKGLKQKEIAKKYNITQPAVQKKIKKGLQGLNDFLILKIVRDYNRYKKGEKNENSN